MTMKLLIGVSLLLVLGPPVLWLTWRSRKQIFGARTVYQELAKALGADWSPPKNAQDTLGPGCVKGRYRDHRVAIDTTSTGAYRRNLLPEAVVRVHFAESLRFGLHGGSGSFRARHPGDMKLADPRLTKVLRPNGKDEAGIQALLADPELATALLALHHDCLGVGLDDGVLSCAVPLPTEVAEIRPFVERALDAVVLVDRAKSRVSPDAPDAHA